MHESFAPLLSSFGDQGPASDDIIRQFVEQSGIFLPQQYIQFLKLKNGGEGFVGQNAYLILWSIDELPEMNKAYNVNENAIEAVNFWNKFIKEQKNNGSCRSAIEHFLIAGQSARPG